MIVFGEEFLTIQPIFSQMRVFSLLAEKELLYETRNPKQNLNSKFSWYSRSTHFQKKKNKFQTIKKKL